MNADEPGNIVVVRLSRKSTENIPDGKGWTRKLTFVVKK